jgi:hypothetical protein
LASIDQLLIAAIKQGPAKKCEAIKKIVQLVPGWTRADCWKRIQRLRKKNPELAAFDELNPSRAQCVGERDPVRRPPLLPWTPADDDKLFTWAGYEPVKRIAQRLGRSEQAVRFRLGSQGISAKVTDGWSLWGLQKLLRVSPGRLRYFIGNGMLRVRDPRISADSMAALCDEIRESLEFWAMERIAAALANGDEAFPWERAANLLGVALTQIKAWVSAGKLRLVDTFVTDRSFEEFCKKHGEELRLGLIDAATAKWLVTEYGAPESLLNCGTVSRARKHALVVRTCKCGRKIAGNPYFRHLKVCQVASKSDLRDTS